MAGKNCSTRELIGIKGFSRNGITIGNGSEIVFFFVQPSNISVLSEESIGMKTADLMHLLSVQPDIEMICSDACESFEANKSYLQERLLDEDNQQVALLLRADAAFLDDIQLQMSTAREFMFAVRLRGESGEQLFSVLNRLEKQIAAQGFACRRANMKDIKRFLTRYFGWSVPDEDVDDFDGNRSIRKWVLPEAHEFGKGR